MFSLTIPNTSLQEIIFQSIWYGFISGMISGMVKIGWEAILPPRTSERNATNPPQRLLEQFGVPSSFTHAYVLYSRDQKVYWFSLILHFSFSIFFATIFIFIAQYWPIIALWQGVAYGIIIWFVWHIVLLPITKTIPAPWKQPFTEHFSEFFGHIIWAWSIAACLYYLISKDSSGILTNF